MEFYWIIETWDKEFIKVKPENVELIQGKIDRKENIRTPDQTIIASNIKDFRISAERYIDQKLLQDVAHAFNEPEYNPDGSIICKWVKKAIPRREYNKSYAAIPSYHILDDADSHVWVAFRLPVHQIDYQKVYDCTTEESERMQKTLNIH